MDSGKTDNERELTSTMGNVLSVSIKDEKNDTSGSDATPTSSTDANTTTTSSQIVSDDPISSTSSDVVELNKSKTLETDTQSSVEVSQTGMEEPDKASSVDPETDLLEMSISSVPRERITEDVEDLVHDLESLLGESTDSFNIPVKRREEQKSLEKETAKISHKPTESGDILLENPALEKSIEIVQNYDKDEKITNDLVNSSLIEEQTQTAESSNKQEIEPCKVETTKDDKVVNENVSVEDLHESEISLECENVITNPQEDQTDTVADKNETINESDSVGQSKSETTESVEEVAEDNVEPVVEKISDVKEAEIEPEVPAEVVEQTTSITEIEDLTNDNSNDDEIKTSEETDVLSVAAEAEPVALTSDGDGNIKKDEPEKTEAADTVCETESISRDTKTEHVESVDDVHEETELSQQEELNTQLVDKEPTESVETVTIRDDKNDKLETENVQSDSIEEIKESEEAAQEIQCETDVATESKLEDTSTTQSESPNEGQIEVLEESTVIVQEIKSPQTNSPPEMDRTADDTESPTTVHEEDSVKSVPDNTETGVEELVEEIELTNEVTESCDTEELKSQTNIPESSETKDGPEDCLEYVENVEEVKEVIDTAVNEPSPIEVSDESNDSVKEVPLEEVVNEDASESSPIQLSDKSTSNPPDSVKEIPSEEAINKDDDESLPVQLLDESNSNQKESPSEADVLQPLEDVITEEASATVPVTEIDLTLVSNEEEIPPIETVIQDDQKDNTETLCTEIESVIEQTTVMEVNELVIDEVPPSPNISNSTDVDNQESKDNFVEEMEVLMSDTIDNVKELVETEINALTESIEEKREAGEFQPEVTLEKTLDIDKDEGDKMENVEEKCEAVELQPEVSLEKATDVGKVEGDETENVEEICEAVELQPESPLVKTTDVGEDDGDKTENVEEKCEAVELQPESPLVKTTDVGEDDGDKTENVEEKCEAVDLQPESPLVKITDVAKDDGDKTENVEEKCEAVELQPESPLLKTTDVAKDDGDKTENVEEKCEAVELQPESPLVKTTDVGKDDGDKTENVEEKCEAVELQPKSPQEKTTDADKDEEDEAENVEETCKAEEVQPEIAQEKTAEVGEDEDEKEDKEGNVEEKREVGEMQPEILLEEAMDVGENEEEKEDKEEKCEAGELQPEISLEGTSDVTENETNKTDNVEDLNTTDEVPKLTEDLEKPCDEASSLQQETPLESEEVVTEDVLVVKSDDISDEVQTEHIEEPPLATVETVEEDTVDCEEIISSPDDICEFSIGTSKDVEPELSSEIVESVLVDDESPKPYDPQLEQDPVTILEELPTEEDKEEPDFEWIEDVVPESEATTTEIIQDDEIEDSSKVIEILDDDDSRIIQSDNVPFFSPAADSDSEDTVPTLVLEPDEVNPSPDLKEIDQIEESSLVVHSTNDSDIPDKLPEIEDILNDQGTVDDVVENIDMQENLETILAVASLQDTESREAVETSVEPHISDKERREMEALRMAVESITGTSSAGFGQVEDLTELVENVETQPLQQIVPEINEVDTVEGSDLKTVPPVDSIQEIKTVPEEKPVESSTVPNSEVSVNEIEVKDDAKIDENHLVQETNDIEETVQTLPDTSEDKVETSSEVQESTIVLPDSSQSVSISEEIKSEGFKEKESKAKTSDRPKRHKKSSVDSKLEELSINVDVPEREKPYSPKVTIKPIKVPDEEVSTTSVSDSELGKGSLKMTITKQFDKMHSVLKICESDTSESAQEQDEPIPKLIIKPKMQQVEQQHSPKMSTRSSKQMYSPTSSTQRSGSPRITIKPVVKPEKESVTPLKIKIKPEEGSKKHSPKLNIKLVTKPEEECRENIQSPRKVTIKPIVKSAEEMDQVLSPRITIKPILKPELEKEAPTTPRLNIKPIKKQDEEDLETERERSSPKITIKPLVKPQEPDTQGTEADDSVKERIVLKINKGNLPTPTKESKKREHPPDDEKSEKLAKITVKFSKIGGHAHIVQQPEESNKRAHEEQSSPEKIKKMKTDNESPVLTRSKHKDVPVEQSTGDTRVKQRESEVHIVETRSKHTHSSSESFIEAKRAKLKDTPETSHTKQKDSVNESSRSKSNSENNDDVRIIESKLDSPIVISEDSRSQDSGSCIIVEDVKDPLGNLSTYEISLKSTPETPPAAPVKQDSASSTPTIPTTPTPRKRGRPRKVPIVVREEFKEQEDAPKPEPKKEEAPQVHESGRPKRSCRGQSVRATLGIKPRKPRGPGRGRGSKRGMGTRVVPMKPEELSK